MKCCVYIIICILIPYLAIGESSSHPYLLSGKVFDKTGNPAKNVEIFVEYSYHQFKLFKTDDDGNYKIEIDVYIPCMSGKEWDFTDTIGHSIQSKLRFQSPIGCAITPSQWKKYYYDTSYLYGSLETHIEHQDIFLIDSVKFLSPELNEFQNKIITIKNEIERYCSLPTDSLLKEIKAFKYELSRWMNGDVDYSLRDTIESVDPYTGKEYREIIGENSTENIRFHSAKNYFGRIGSATNRLLQCIELRNQPISSLYDRKILGICNSLIRLEKVNANTYHYYYNVLRDSWKMEVTVDSKGIITGIKHI